MALVVLVFPLLSVTGGERGPFDKLGGEEWALGELDAPTAVRLVDGGVNEGNDGVGEGDAELGVGDEAELAGVEAEGKDVDTGATVGALTWAPRDGAPTMVVQPPTPLMNTQLFSKTVLMTSMAGMREGVGEPTAPPIDASVFEAGRRCGLLLISADNRYDLHPAYLMKVQLLLHRQIRPQAGFGIFYKCSVSTLQSMQSDWKHQTNTNSLVNDATP
ncbi:hypothetical protein V8D89_001208 [Ganoderma adspersum]